MIAKSAKPTPEEILAPLPGDNLVPDANVISDTAITINAPPDQVYSYLSQMGRRDEGRGGWPLPASVERFIPKKGRGLRNIDSAMALKPGDTIGDWANPSGDVMAEVIEAEAPYSLVFTADRGKNPVSWALSLREQEDGHTRLQTRLRIGGVEHSNALSRLSFVDRLAVVGLKKGIEERLADSSKK